MSRKIVEIRNGIVANPQYAMASPIDFSILEGEQIAVLGDNASGKTRFAEILTGRHRLKGDSIKFDFGPDAGHFVSDNLKFVTFKDSYGTADTGYYFQQRFNQIEIDPEMPTVGELFESFLRDKGEKERTMLGRLSSMFGLDELKDKYIITLSSGELRKFQLTKILLTLPRLVIIDNPFIGLDAAARAQLAEFMEELTLAGELTFVILVSREDEIPSFITHIVDVKGLEVGSKRKAEPNPGHCCTELKKTDAEDQSESSEVLRFRDVCIRYGGRTILKDLDWTVRKGEHWALTGENGSGKSTLLSLVCADNPQAYACNIELFGRKRGTGESIWDIKKHIGFVSPEMHRSYCKSLPSIDIVTSGLFDTVGLFRTPSEEQKRSCMKWMDIFGISHLADCDFMRISSGEQRLCLLARAFVKEPDLLILDEPMHGLDDTRREMVKRIISEYCTDRKKTLVMVTHYLEELPDCIDHSLVLHRN